MWGQKVSLYINNIEVCIISFNTKQLERITQMTTTSHSWSTTLAHVHITIEADGWDSQLGGVAHFYTNARSSFALHWDGNISTVSHPHSFRHICLWHLSVYPVWQTFLTVSLSLCACTETRLFFSISRVSFLDVFSCPFAPTDLFPPFGNIQAQRPETTQSPPRLWWRSEDKTACFRKPQRGKFSAHNIHLECECDKNSLIPTEIAWQTTLPSSLHRKPAADSYLMPAVPLHSILVTALVLVVVSRRKGKTFAAPRLPKCSFYHKAHLVKLTPPRVKLQKSSFKQTLYTNHSNTATHTLPQLCS